MRLIVALLSLVGFAASLEAQGEAQPAEVPRWKTPAPGEFEAFNQRASLIQRGRESYLKYCVGCHGRAGDGKGVAAERLITQPRDFTKGIYKFRSTDSGSLPLESDLYRTLRRGLSRVSMPAFPLMPEHEMVAVIEYVKTFYPDWDKDKDQRKIVPVPEAPTDLKDESRILRGRVVYLAMQCGKCHGSDGAGTGATQTQYTDAWGNPQKAFNFTRGRLKGGDDPGDIYRTFHTGLRSIMPAYGGTTLATANRETFESQKQYLAPGEMAKLESVMGDFPATAAEVFSKLDEKARNEMAQRNSWDLVAYILSLKKPVSTAEAVLGISPSR